MRKITVASLAAALVLSATPALAAKTNAKDQAATEESGGATGSERKVCKRLENSGTRMKNDRVCLTRAEWRKVEDAK